jgi:hypothetical protein
MGIFKRSTVGILFALISSLAKVHGYSQSRACARKGATILPRLHAQDPVSRLETEVIKTTAKTGSTVPGPPVDTKPDYANIIGPLGKRMDQVFLSVFRGKLAEQVGVDSSLPSTDFKAITDLAGAMNARFTNRLEIQRRAHAVLRALFPSWLPRSYAVLFSKPFPAVSASCLQPITIQSRTNQKFSCFFNTIQTAVFVSNERLGDKNYGNLAHGRIGD